MHKAEKLIAINGLTWPVATDGINIQIGCQQHTVAEWSTFTDDEIASMNEHALVFWRNNKELVMRLATAKATV